MTTGLDTPTGDSPVPRQQARGTDYPRLILMALALVIAVVTGLLLQRHLVVSDLSNEPAPFNTMELPLQWVHISQETRAGFGAGEGITVEMADATGKQFAFHFPVSTSLGKTTYPRVIHEGKPLENAARVKGLCLRLLRMHKQGGSDFCRSLAES